MICLWSMIQVVERVGVGSHIYVKVDYAGIVAADQ